MPLIAFAGYATSGKDTAANYLVEKYGYERRAFADKLKDSVAALLNINREQIERWKLDPDVEIQVVRKVKDGFSVLEWQTFRNFLQRYGTESHRDVLHEHIWIDYTLAEYHSGLRWAISDLRFENEAKAVRSQGGKVVWITRPGVEGQEHRSEHKLPKDYYDALLVNNDSLEVFYRRIDAIMKGHRLD